MHFKKIIPSRPSLKKRGKENPPLGEGELGVFSKM
jgi:hypothetical protein